MFESLDSQTGEQKAEDSVSVGEALGVYALILLLAFGSVVAFIALGDRPYGAQVATLISYSGAVFIWSFFKTRGINTSHSLSDSYVQEQVPRLLLIHILYMVALFLLQKAALSVRSSMSDWWLTSLGRLCTSSATLA
jgi:NADH:ubiquinone oxidoreductase subunit 6 (subunit J)